MKLFGIPVLVLALGALVGYAIAKRTPLNIPFLAP